MIRTLELDNNAFLKFKYPRREDAKKLTNKWLLTIKKPNIKRFEGFLALQITKLRNNLLLL